MRGLTEQALHRSLARIPGGLEMKRLEDAAEAWIISDIKPRVHEGDKRWRAQPCARLLTHNVTVSHANLDHDISSGSTILPCPDLPVTVSLNTTTFLYRRVAHRYYSQTWGKPVGSPKLTHKKMHKTRMSRHGKAQVSLVHHGRSSWGA